MRVEVVDSVALAVSNDTVICSGQSVTLRAMGAQTYQWYPSDGLSCVDCADPVASPTATTIYTVIGSAAGGCSTQKQALVVVLDETRARLTGAAERRVAVGRQVRIPIELSGPIDVSRLQLHVEYDPGMVRIDTILVGSALSSDWRIQSSRESPGSVTVALQSDAAAALSEGEVLAIALRAYLSTTLETDLRVGVDSSDARCSSIEGGTTRLQVDSLCGLDLRLIEVTSASRAAALSARPDPTRETGIIRYELPLEGRVEIDLYDARGGRIRTVVDAVEAAGEHQQRIAVTDLSSGTYFCRLRFGDVVREVTFRVVR